MNDIRSLRLVFAGTPDFAAAHLQRLVDDELNIVAVYTQPDRPAGRGKKLSASPVKQLALNAGIPVFQPASLRDETAQAELADLQPDVLVVVAYGLILPQAVLDIPRQACINVHASLLPRWRGAAPIQRAIEAGDAETGITIMQMEAGLDSGPMLDVARLSVSTDMSAADLHDALAEIGPAQLVNTLSMLDEKLRDAQTQDETGASYANKLEKSEAEMDWRLAADTLQRRIMAFNPFPGCWTLLGTERLKIWRAVALPEAGTPDARTPGEILWLDSRGPVVACGDGALLLTEMQLPGGRAMAAADMLRARSEHFKPGTILGSTTATEPVPDAVNQGEP